MYRADALAAIEGNRDVCAGNCVGASARGQAEEITPSASGVNWTVPDTVVADFPAVRSLLGGSPKFPSERVGVASEPDIPEIEGNRRARLARQEKQIGATQLVKGQVYRVANGGGVGKAHRGRWPSTAREGSLSSCRAAYCASKRPSAMAWFAQVNHFQ